MPFHITEMSCKLCGQPRIIFNPRIRLVNGKTQPLNPDGSPHTCRRPMTDEEIDNWIVKYLTDRVNALQGGLRNKQVNLLVLDLKNPATTREQSIKLPPLNLKH